MLELLALLCAATVSNAPKTLPQPQLFSPGVISGPASDGTPTFTPDGKTLFFTRSGTRIGTILESHRVGSGWSAPRIAPFSGEWNDQHAVMSPDGAFLVFVSTRPAPGESEHVAHLWRSERTPHGWGEPKHLPATVNIGPRIFAPSVAADGSLYFLSIGKGRTMRLYRSRFVGGAYQQAEPLPFSTDATADVDPEIAPDQSYLVFASAGRHGKDDTKEHLYIVFNERGTWGEIKPLRYEGDDANGGSTDNEPLLSPDGHTLYFSSDRSPGPPHLPRSRGEAEADLKRIEQWDNSNSNVWSIPFDAGSRQRAN